MAYQSIDLGTSPGDGTGDDIRDGGDKINDNFDEIYTLLGTRTALTSGMSATATVITLTTPTLTTPTLTTPTISGVVGGTQTSATITTLTSSTISSGSTITLDAETDITLDANGGDIYLKDDGTIFGTLTNNGGNLTIKNSASEVAAIQIAGDEVVTFADDLIIKDGGTIGVTSATTALTISAAGNLTGVGTISDSSGALTGEGTVISLALALGQIEIDYK